MKGKLHIPALWLDAYGFYPLIQNLIRRFALPAMLIAFVAQTSSASPANSGLVRINTGGTAIAPALTLETTGPDSAACGDLITVNIRTISGYTDIGSLQYSVNWDENQLQYVSLIATQIGGVGGEPITGTGNVANGELTYSWVDPSGTDGEDLPDSTVLLSITFKVIVSSGVASVDITGTPLAIEVADNLLDTGTVTVQNNADIVLGLIAVSLVLADDEACPTDTALILTGGSPPGGVFSGPGVTDSLFDATVAGVGDHIITYTYTDTLGCTNSATDTVTVGDFVMPVINCPVPALADTADANCEFAFSGTSLDATATDDCAVDSITNDFTNTATLDGAVFPEGITVVTWTAVDFGGNTATCTVEITVTDVTPPTIVCPADTTVNTDPGNCDAVVNGLTATATDNCPVTVTWSVASGPALADPGTSTAADVSGAVFALGTTVIEYLVTDPGGNTATCTFSVTVVDTEMFVVTPLPPGLVTFQDTFQVNTAPGACSQNVSWYRASFLTHVATDNCPDTFSIVEGVAEVNGTPDPNFFTNNGVTPYPYDYNNPLHQVTPVSAAFPVGTTIIPYHFIDMHLDTVTVTVTVIVEEIEPPSATCVSDTIILPLDGSGNAVLTPAMVDGGSSDNCFIDSMTVSPSAFDCSDVSAIQTVTLVVTDLAGNVDSCTALVDVVDNLLPVILCPNDRLLVAGVNCDTSDATLGMVPESDLANLEPGEYYDNSGACDSGQVTVTYTVNGGPAIPIANLPTHLFSVGISNVTIQVTPEFGLPATCSFTVTVEDQTSPVTLNCPPSDTVNANLGGCLAQVNWTPPVFTDNCPGALFLQNSHDPGSFFIIGPTTVTYTATDSSGNVGVCTFVIFVQDLQPPVAKCKDISASLDANGVVTVSPAQLDDNSTDNCFYDYVTVDSVYDCTSMGPNAYTLIIVDGGGNVDSVTCTLTIVDTISGIKDPAITNCAAFTPDTVSLDPNCTGTLDAAAFALNFTFTDNTLNSLPSCPLSFDVDVDGSGFSPEYQWNCADAGANTLTFRVSDVFGNSAVCTKTVFVKDVTPPIILNADSIAPPAVTIECSDFDPNDLDTLGQITFADVTDACDDSCDVALTISFSDTTGPGACDNAIIVTRTWKVTDAAGNMAFHTQTISVVDTQSPVLTGVQPLDTLQANNYDGSPSCSATHTVALSDANVSDNCTPSDLSFYDISYEIQFPAGFIPSTPGSSVTQDFPIGTSTVTFTVADPCGNTAQTTVTVVVEDVDGPIVNEPFGKIFGNLQTVCDSTFVILNATGNCGNTFTWYRPFRDDDDFLDCSFHDVTETISDPTVQSALNGSVPFVYTNPPLFSVHPSTFFPVGETVITYLATDEFNNTTTCAFTVRVVDNEPPAISCPGDQTLSISSGCTVQPTVPSYLSGVQVTDNCLNNVVLTQTPAPGTPLSDLVNPVEAGQTFSVTVIAMDSFLNNLQSAPCTFTVTLADGEAPVPNVPILPIITSFCGIDTVEAPSASDCNGNTVDTIYGTPSVPVIEILPPLMPGGPPRYVIPAGNYAITWSYTDPQNNTTTQLQSVQIIGDNNPPLALCMPPFSVDLSAAGEYLPSVAEIDNGSSDPDMCGPVTLSLSPTVLTCANLSGPATVTLTVTDVSGNTAQCVTPVTVNDVTAPVMSPIPANDTLGSCALIPPPAGISAIDICDDSVAVVLVQDTIDFINIYSYTIRRTWTATDDSGNAVTGTQIIVIVDDEAPVFSAAAPDTIMVFTELNDLDCQDTISIDILPFVSDCDSTLIITNNRTGQGANYSEILDVGVYSLIFTAEDGGGHTSTHEVVLQVKDGTDPIAVCINGVSVSLQPSGTVIITPVNVDAGSSDNCTDQDSLDMLIQRLDPQGSPGPSITFSCPDADGVTEHPVRLIVRDEAGNQSTCETFIIVQDNVFPQITFCPPGKTLLCSDDLSPAAQGTAEATDNCILDQIEFTDSTAAADSGMCSVIYRIWQARDQGGNLTTCVQVFNIVDTVKPVFVQLPANDTLSCNDTLAIVPFMEATDNCDADVQITLVVDTIDVGAGDCGQFSYTIRRTWTAIDNCGNSDTYSQQLVLTDVVAPEFAGMPDTLSLFSADFPPNTDCTVPLSFDAGQYLTDCQPNSAITVTNSSPFGSGGADISGNYTVGQYLIKFSATDACGNEGVDSIVVNVTDNSIPTVICNDDVVVALGTNGFAIIQPGDIDLGTNDNCGIDTMYLSEDTFDCSDVGLNPVTLTVVDSAGNSNFCTVNVEVTAGAGGGFTLTVTSTAESYFGADDGSAMAVATGGSGQFTFTWSNGGTTAGINGLSAGTYIVTVVDTIGGCTLIDTAVVEPGAKITLTVGPGSGCQGQTISIPVTVDNFFDITGFGFTVHIGVDSIGTILGVTAGSINPLIADGFSANVLGGNNLGINWADTVLTLPAGTVLFNIDVQLGMATVGSGGPIVITNTPVLILFTQDSSGVAVPVGMVDIQNDSLMITCNFGDDIQIGGDIQTWRVPTVPVPGVEVTLTGTVTANQTTGAAGTYLFGVALNDNTTVKCFKETAGNNGITGADILLIKRHALGIQPLVNPYQFVAADVSGEGNLSLIDYARIQEVALGTKQHITGSPDWKFVPKSYVFPSPDPLSVPFPDSISHFPVDMSYLDDDFVAVRMGDVNGNHIPTFTNDDDTDVRSGLFLFRLEERELRVGETIEVPFRAKDFIARSGYQMTLNFDPQVFELQGIVPGDLPDMSEANFGTAYLSEGWLTTLWVNAEPLTLTDDEVLFTLKFKVLRNAASLAEVLRPGSKITRAEGYDAAGEEMDLDFEFVRKTGGEAIGVFALYQNQPNPFDNTTSIGFRLPEASRATLRIFSSSGQLLRIVERDFAKGYHELNFRRGDFGAAGVYYYELQTTGHNERRKMVLTD